MNMHKHKLVCFNMPASRGEPLRMAMYVVGVDYTDECWTFPEFREKHSEHCFREVPVLDIDAKIVTQSNTIRRFLDKQAGFILMKYVTR